MQFEEDLVRFKKIAEEYTLAATQSADAAREALAKTGMYYTNGTLKEEYK